MNPEHAKRISQACKSNGKAVTFRATNKDCMDKIRKGALAKPLAIKDKTISKKSLSKAVQDPEILQKVKKYDLMGYVGVYDKNKKLIGVRTTQGANPPKGILPIDRIPPPPEPRTTFSGDYDVHDFFGKGGRKIASGSVEEQKFMRQMNHAIGRGPSVTCAMTWSVMEHNPPTAGGVAASNHPRAPIQSAWFPTSVQKTRYWPSTPTEKCINSRLKRIYATITSAKARKFPKNGTGTQRDGCTRDEQEI